MRSLVLISFLLLHPIVRNATLAFFFGQFRTVKVSFHRPPSCIGIVVHSLPSCHPKYNQPRFFPRVEFVDSQGRIRKPSELLLSEI